MGQADLPENHHSQNPCSDPPCGHLDGFPCDFHAEEIDHARGDHEYCDLRCRDKFPSDMLRNSILCRAIAGSQNMLKELERRARESSGLRAAHTALAAQAGTDQRALKEAREDIERLTREKQELGRQLDELTGRMEGLEK